MRRTSVPTVLVVLSAGLAAAATVRRIVGRRRAALASAAPAAPAVVPVVPVAAPVPVVAAPAEPVRDAVVLAFAPRIVSAPAPAQAARAARCGDSGGRTKSGAPCGARAAAGGRCRHHPVAA